MAKGKKVTDLVKEMLEPFLAENGYELFLTEFVKEGKDWYLRVYIDSESGISIADCEKVSRFLSECLDKTDPIEQNYLLEVSSPGLDRPLIRREDFEKYKGQMVDVMLYRPVEGSKQHSGILEGRNEEILFIGKEDGGQIQFRMEDVSRVKLAVIF